MRIPRSNSTRRAALIGAVVSLLLVFAPAAAADGCRLGFDLAGRCRAVRIPKVAKGTSAVVKVAGVRYDVKVGTYRRVRLAGGRNTAGPATRLPKKICR